MKYIYFRIFVQEKNIYMKYTYQVAKIRFGVEAEPTVWGTSAYPYLPFSVPQDLTDELHFTLKILPGRNETAAEYQELGDFGLEGTHLFISRTKDNDYLMKIGSSETPDQLGSLYIRSDFSKGELWLNDITDRWLTGHIINNALMILFPFAAANQHVLLVHSSAVIYQNKAYLFLGKSGSGKSTHSHLWLETFEGAELLNDDNPAIRVEKDGTVTVYGTPWSGKTPCYKNKSIELGGLALIVQAPYNSIQRQPILKAYFTLRSAASTMKWERRLSDPVSQTVNDILKAVPLFTLECLPNKEAALTSCQAFQEFNKDKTI